MQRLSVKTVTNKCSMKSELVKIIANLFFALCVICYPLILCCTLVHQIIDSLKQKQPKSIKGDVAVVTGAAGGLGREICLQLAKQGCQIAVVDINSEESEHTVQLVTEQYHVKAKAYQVDVSNYEAVKDLNKNIINDFGSAATILVNNAGVLVFSDLIEPSHEEVQRMINVNLTAHFWTTNVFLPNMKAAKKGHITAISSVAGLVPLVYNAEYTSTKWAVRALMKTLKLELKMTKETNINTTCVFPAFLQTNQTVAELVKTAEADQIYPLIPGDEVATRIVNGMLVNEENIYLPEFVSLGYRLYELLPSYWQDLPVVTVLADSLNKLLKPKLAYK